MTTVCQACRDHPTTDLVCQQCMDILHGNLALLPHLHHELLTEVCKLARKTTGPSSHARRTEQPLPYAPHASDLAHALRNELATAVRIIALDQTDDLPSDDVDDMCAWLTRHETSIPLRAEGPDITNGIATIVARATRCIDPPPERLYIGQCDCGTDMYPRRGQAIHRCPCSAEWDVPEVVAWRDQQAQDHLLTLADIALLSGIKPATLKSWAKRGRILPAGRDRDGARTYRYGDALNLRRESA